MSFILSLFLMFLEQSFAQDYIHPRERDGHITAEYTPHQDFHHWCGNQHRHFGSLKIKATQLYLEGLNGNSDKFKDSYLVLKDGMEKILNDYEQNFPNTFAIKVIRDGFDIINYTEQSRTDERNYRALVNFLFHWYDLIRETLNAPYEFPFDHYYPGIDLTALENRFIDVSRKEMALVLNELTTKIQGGRAPQNNGRAPVGTPELFLRSLELTTYFYYRDLSRSLLSGRHPLLMRDLILLSDELYELNKQPLDPRVSTYYIQYYYQWGKSILGNSGPTLSNAAWIPFLSDTVTVHQYQPKRYDLSGENIQFLRIFADGKRRDTRLKIWVNGIQKADIFVPAYDPKYELYIGENYVHTLEFESQFGDTIIRKIEFSGFNQFHYPQPRPLPH